VVFLAASGALLAALLRSFLFERDDPLVMVSVGLRVDVDGSVSVAPGSLVVIVSPGDRGGGVSTVPNGSCVSGVVESSGEKHPEIASRLASTVPPRLR
jgi:hypothetical protein